MAAKQPSLPTVGKRQLARELRRSREAAKFTLDQVADELDWAKTKVHNYEHGRWTRGNLTDLRALLDLYGIHEPERRASLENLMRDAKRRGWWSAFGDAFDGSLPAFEDEATQMSSYEPVFIPGLLQKREYATSLMNAYAFLAPDDIERKVEARMRRQEILNRQSPPIVSFVIEEAAVQRMIGIPKVFGPQVQHLIDLAQNASHVSIQVMPLRSGLHGALGSSFVILDFAGDYDLSIVHTETATRSGYLENKEEVALHRTMFTHACGSALSQEDSSALLTGLLQQHT
ncbi:helix-turn-helix protein [Murinocardiopsis flavida]|uniref:Helix-turn-helix protein n=1 Tax=Murinocardiopsis flavida TaxID=645275 RepID=A0A2P8CWR3_9ACTN|nr:helix-turn-helix transcriptional regulator [Murinocardiopsis flavida]PSK89405.1 helix-turn-helix protein [Murinocardiopsis flavida]